MARRPDTLEKSWIVGPSRGTQTFNAPSNLFIDYGRHVATVSGRGGSGNAPSPVTITNYNTLYNVQYVVKETVLGNRPATAWVTNYNVNYPFEATQQGNQPATAWVTNYNTFYNVNYPPGNQPATAWVTNYNTFYNVEYPIKAQPQGNQPATAWVTNYNVVYGPGNQPVASVDWIASYWVDGFDYIFSQYPIQITSNFYGTNLWNQFGTNANLPDPVSMYANAIRDEFGGPLSGDPSQGSVVINYSAATTNYNTNYNVNYPPENQPATAWVTNYNTFYNVQYSIKAQPQGNQPATAWVTNYNVVYGPGSTNPANQPATAWVTNYNTFYNVEYPIKAQPQGNQPATAWVTNYNTFYNIEYKVKQVFPGNQPATTWVTNYNIAYGFDAVFPGNQPATAWVTNYNTNYNIVYSPGNQPETAWISNYNTFYNVEYPVESTPPGNQPIVSYIPGTTGTPTNVLGVYFPGGPVDTAAPYIPETVVNYWEFKDNDSHPIQVPSGGQIIVKIE